MTEKNQTGLVVTAWERKSYTVDSQSVQYYFLEYLPQFFVIILSVLLLFPITSFSVLVSLFLLQLEQNIQVKYVNRL